MTTVRERPEWLPTDVWPFELRSMGVETGRVAYTDVGQGPALVFCHAGMWSFVWRDVILELSSQYRCVAFDPPGSGLSERIAPERRTLATVRDSIRELWTCWSWTG